jgi:uncharacterized protein (DUF1015 family)
MAEVRGLRALRFDPQVVGGLDAVVTPPFDVITPHQRRELRARSPFNMVHLILPEEDEGMSRYEAAARDMDEWIRQGVLKQDAQASFYLLQQTFQGPDGQCHVRHGFYGVTQIPEDNQRIVLDHERTFEEKIRDRLALTEATRANLGAVLTMYSDAQGELASFLDQMNQRPEDMRIKTIDGVLQQIWQVPEDLDVVAFFRHVPLYIADGHHRFRTACAYRKRVRARNGNAAGPHDFVLMGYVAMEDPGLRIWPAHRLADKPPGFDEAAFVERAEQWFHVAPVGDDLTQRVETSGQTTIGVAIAGGGRYLFTLHDLDRAAFLDTKCSGSWLDLDVAVLHKGILERILGFDEGAEFVYEHNTAAALDALASGQKGLAFFLRPASPAQVRACAEAGDPMPHKATYFFPKLPSGAVIHRLEEN